MTPTRTRVLMDHLLIRPIVTSLPDSIHVFVLNSKDLPPLDLNLPAVFMST